MEATEILVIILSSFLALFLLLAIILTSLLIRLTIQIKRMTDTAETAVDHISQVASNASMFISPLALGKIITNKMKKTKN